MNSDGFRAPYEAYDNTTKYVFPLSPHCHDCPSASMRPLINSGDVFWAAADNTSLIYVNDADRVVMKGESSSIPDPWDPVLSTEC
jgi:hypothetical protein